MIKNVAWLGANKSHIIYECAKALAFAVRHVNDFSPAPVPLTGIAHIGMKCKLFNGKTFPGLPKRCQAPFNGYNAGGRGGRGG
ncbi:MAG: hypothetical protein FWF29_01725, partial [Treponema sp.]|nr:hypothetical protein [Treponema sp.]